MLKVLQERGGKMQRYSYPAWDKDLQERVNATGGAGMPGIVRFFNEFNRAGQLVDRPEFMAELRILLERFQPRSENLCEWMTEALEAFLGFPVEVPDPSSPGKRQRNRLEKYGYRPFFIPAITEDQYPERAVRYTWDRYLDTNQVERIPLAGEWVWVEVITKPKYSAGVYPNDQLITDIGLETRFRHPHSGKGEGDDIVGDLIPKIAKRLSVKSDQVDLPSAEQWNFLANFWNFLREQFSEDLPGLGSSASVEWVKNTYGSEDALLVGNSVDGGLAYVNYHWRDGCGGGIGFRSLVRFP